MNPREGKPPETLAERFWSLARGMDRLSDSTEPTAVVEHVVAVLDALDGGKVGRDLTANTINFLTLLRRHEVKGDLLYASPEQARGEMVDERSLVFSVGVLLFEKLTGRHPFGAEGNPQRLARIQRGEMASGVNYFPRIPAELRAVLLRAMGPFPEERWNSLAELRAELDRFVGLARRPESRHAPMTRPLPGESIAAPGRTSRRTSQDPAAALSRMATMSGLHSAVRPERDGASERPRRRRRRLPPGAWMFAGVVTGVLATSLVFIAAWPDRPAAVRIAPSARATVRTAPVAPPPAAPEPERTSTQTAPAAASPSGAFDPEAGGKAALAVVRDCVAADRKAQFGASLLYESASGLSRRVYFGAVHELERAERACLETSLLQLPAGGRPERSSIVTYTFRLSPSGDHVRARLQPQP
jgi:hypothetical protein